MNASIDGNNWITVQDIQGPQLNQTTHRQIEPTVTRVIRLIPITDRRMPVCIRMELYGCYVDTVQQDDFMDEYINFALIMILAIVRGKNQFSIFFIFRVFLIS